MAKSFEISPYVRNKAYYEILSRLTEGFGRASARKFEGVYWLSTGCVAFLAGEKQIINPSALRTDINWTPHVRKAKRSDKYHVAKVGATCKYHKSRATRLISDNGRTNIDPKYMEWFKNCEFHIHESDPLAPIKVMSVPQKRGEQSQIVGIIMPIRMSDDEFWEKQI